MIRPRWLPVYDAALTRVRSYIASFNAVLYGPRQEKTESVRISLRARRDYWHALGSKILRRMERERDK